MPTTRYSDNPDDFSPERKLASGKLRGISIGLNIVARVARVLPDAERGAMLWLANYATLRDLTADALSEELDLDKAEIRRSLTDPEADRERFCRQVAAVRAAFEKALPALANTAVKRKVTNAIKFADGEPQIVEIVGKTRTGKTVAAHGEYLRRMDRAAWLHCPAHGTDRDFLYALCQSLGVSFSSATKVNQVIPKIEACFGPNRLRMLFVDEGHRLWPNDLRREPKRIEFLRDLWERLGVSVVILATPQYSESLAQAMDDNPRWAPGQWDGRVQRFHLSDTMSDADLTAVAGHHLDKLETPPCGNVRVQIIAQLVEQARSSEGFAGAMVKAIQRATFMAQMEGKALELAHIKSAQAELARGTRIEQLARGHSKSKTHNPKLLTGRAA